MNSFLDWAAGFRERLSWLMFGGDVPIEHDYKTAVCGPVINNVMHIEGSLTSRQLCSKVAAEAVHTGNRQA